MDYLLLLWIEDCLKKILIIQAKLLKLVAPLKENGNYKDNFFKKALLLAIGLACFKSQHELDEKLAGEAAGTEKALW